MTEQKEFVDFNVGLGDSGEDTLTAIQPVSDGEGASQVQFRRPSENLRERTETLRDTVGELLYHRDYSHLMIEYTGGTITWNGPAPGASPLGKISVTAGNFIFSPMLAPYQAKKGVLNVGTVSSNRVIYTVASTSYATHKMNAVTVKHLSVPGTSPLTATISAGPVKRIVVTFDSANSGHDAAAAQTALATAIAADTDLAGRLIITTSALSNVTIASLAETRIDSTADDEKHVVSGPDIETLTTTTPLQPGMGIAIWYRYVVEPVGFGSDPKGGLAGGRAESSGDRGTSAIPSAALFVTHVNPEKIPGAIPICRVGYNGQLIWYDGTRLQPGESFTFVSPTSAASTALSSFTTSLSQVNGATLVGYSGSGFWADGTTNVSGATVKLALDEIVADLAAFTATSPGANRIGVDASTIFTGALTPTGGGGALTAASTTLRTTLDQLDAAVINRRAFTAVITDNVASVGGDINTANFVTAINTLGATGGTYFFRRGAYTFNANLTTDQNTHFIGEDVSKVSLKLDTTRVFSGDTLNDILSFENVYLKGITNGLSDYRFTSGSYILRNCRATAGIISIEPVADVRLDIDGLIIDDDSELDQGSLGVNFSNASPETQAVTGIIRRMRMTAIPTGTTGIFKSALRFTNIGTKAASKTYEPLIFEDCYIDISTGFSDAGSDDGVILGLSNVYQPLVYRNCVFRSSQVNPSITPVIAELINASNILFDNCSFIQDGYGKTLRVSGFSNNVRFRSCKFYTSPLAVNYPEIEIACDEEFDTDPAQNVVFEDCYIEVRFGTSTGSSTQRRIQIGVTSAPYQPNGNLSYSINGLHINLNYTNVTTVSDYTVSIIGGDSIKSVVDAQNITIDLRGKRLAGANTRVIHLSSVGTGSLEVRGLYLKNVTEPDTTAGATANTCSLVELAGGRINGGSINGTAAGANVSPWRALITLTGAGSSVEGMRIYDASPANRGRVFRCSGRNKIIGNTVVPSALATGENITGWFCEVDGAGNIISSNTVKVGGPGQGYGLNGELLLLSTTAEGCTVSSNLFQATDAHIQSISVLGSLNSVVGNVLRTSSTVNEYVMQLNGPATRNVITGNTFICDGTGSPSYYDDTSDPTGPNFAFGNTYDAIYPSSKKIIAGSLGHFNGGYAIASYDITSTAAGAECTFDLNSLVPLGATITLIRVSVQMSTGQATSTNRMSISFASVDNVGTVSDISATTYAPVNGTGQQFISTGAINYLVIKSIKSLVLKVSSSINAANDTIHSVEVTYTTNREFIN